MTVKRKALPSKEIKQYDIEDVISRGGKTTYENNLVEKKEFQFKFTMRVPHKLVAAMDVRRKERPGNISRNQWIIEAILDRLEK